MKLTRILPAALVLVAWTVQQGAGAAGGDYQPHADIRDRVLAFLEAETGATALESEIRIGRLDPRLRLHRCEEEISAFLPSGRAVLGNVTVGVRCEGSQPWTLYVRARVKLFREVAVLNRSIARGEVIQPADVTLEVVDTSGLARGYFTRVEDVAGMQARRTLTAGRPLTATMLTPPTLVRRGDKITVLAQAGSIVVRSEAKALTDGVRGQVVRARNLRSRKVVEGVVLSAGVIRVSL